MPYQPALADCARGVIVGLACGDALGAPVEFESRETIAERYPNGLRDFTSGGWMEVEPGELTDDSRMMIDLAETLARPGPPDMDHLAQRFIAWMEEGPKDIGNTTRLAIQLLSDGVPWSEAGVRAVSTLGAQRTASNGSVMRCAPVAVRYHRDPVNLRQVSLDTARITHAEPRCTWGAVAINQAIAHALGGGSGQSLISAAKAEIEQPEVVAEIEAVPGLQERDLKGTGYVLNAVQIALWSVLKTSNFEDAVVGAVMVGDDTDTNAAVTGALAGAIYGYDGIPERWRSRVQQRDRLVSLADQLVALGSNADTTSGS
jgi:ADP-ribosyl-[dinitrogen reductase] hydrolase